MLLKVTLALPEPPAARVIEGWMNVVVSTPPGGPVKLLERATAPANPLVAAGLPRLVDRTVTW